jgi:hypothetical protein
VEEPELPEHHRSGGQSCNHETGDRRDERHERQQPDQILGRDELREREEAGDRSGRCQNKSLAVDTGATDEPQHEQHRRHLQRRRHPRENVGQRPREVPRDSGGRAADDLRVVDPDAVRCEQQRAREALELERALRLRFQALPDAVPTDQRERADHDHDNRSKGEERTHEAACTHRQTKEGEKRERVELRGHGQAEQREAERRPLVEQRAHSRGHKQRRPGVVGVERHRPERQRGKSESGKHAVQPPRPGAEADEHHRRNEQRQ